MRLLACLFLLAAFAVPVAAQETKVNIYQGAAPGSETWNWPEKTYYFAALKLKMVYNVTNPSLTVFKPDPSYANGTAIIVCPGGGFYFLSIDSEGNEVARWLQKQGYTVFVLRYRTEFVSGENPFNEMMASMSDTVKQAKLRMVIPLSVADGKASIAWVRSHAAEYKINPNRIGIIGFSAGGTVAGSAAFDYTPENKPDFVAPVYAFLPDSLQGKMMPDAPPMFLLCATDDQLGLATHSISLYNKWLAAKKPVEMHLYARGGHGFGMKVQHLPTDNWIERFAEWLVLLKLNKPAI